jgi:saccharopine dehydrogenase-like NADP-dependent oxidoreductase
MNLRYFTLFILSNLFFLVIGKSQTIPMTFHNGSLKSIPLNIPGVMNPNLSPISDSGVTLEVGQKVFYFPNGKKGKKELFRDEFVRSYYPKKIAGETWRAISWTTAASIVSVIEMVSNKQLPQKGYLKQEEIALDKFLKTKSGGYYK